MKLLTIIQVGGWILCIVLIAPRILAAQQVDAAAGKAVYSKNCAACHGAAGEGKEALAKALKVEMRRLGSKEVQAKADGDLRKDVTAGVGKMKPVEKLSEKDLGNLIAYLRGLAEK